MSVRSVQFYLLLAYFVIPHHLFFMLWKVREIKPFDIAALLIALLLLASLLLTSNTKLISLNKFLYIFPFWYFLRSLFAIPEIGMSTILFGLKFIEYLIIFVAIKNLHLHQKNKLFKYIIVATVCFLLVEAAGVSLGPGWGWRFSAQYGGPYELGAIALIVAIVYSRQAIKLGAIVATILSGAKASIAGLCIGLFVNMRGLGRLVFILGLVSISGVLLSESRIAEFIQSLNVLSHADFKLVFNEVPSVNNYDEYLSAWLRRNAFTENTGVDSSTAQRLYSYILAVKSLSDFDYFIGKGPGFFTSALDSSLLRVFVETGLIGIILLGLFLRELFEKIGSNGLMVAVLFNMMFVDVLFSARFLVLLFLIYEIKNPRKDYRNAFVIQE